MKTVSFGSFCTFPKVGVHSCLLKSSRSFWLQVKVWYLPCKGLYPSARRGETAARPWEGTEAPAGRQSANIWVIFFCRKTMFYLAYLFCFSSVCSLCLAGLGDSDLGLFRHTHLCAWMKSERACLEGNVLLFLAVTLLLLIERSLLCLIAKITGIFNRATNSPWRGIKNTERKMLI